MPPVPDMFKDLDTGFCGAGFSGSDILRRMLCFWSERHLGRLLPLLLLLFFVLALTSCGGNAAGVESTFSLPTFTPGSISLEERNAFLETLRTAPVNTGTGRKSSEALKQYLEKDTRVAAMFINTASDLQVWLRDGSRFYISSKISDEPISDPRSASTQLRTHVPSRTATNPARAFLLAPSRECDIALFNSIAEKLATHGYSSTISLGNSLAELLSNDSYRLLFLGSERQRINFTYGDDDDYWYYNLPKVTYKHNYEQYKEWFDGRSLICFVVRRPNGGVTGGGHDVDYWPTVAFSPTFMFQGKGMSPGKLERGALLVNASIRTRRISAYPNTFDWYDRMLPEGQGAYFEGPKLADESVAFLIDRLLGKNQIEPLDNPKQPPFTFSTMAVHLNKVVRPGSSVPYSKIRFESAVQDGVMPTLNFYPGSSLETDYETLFPVIRSTMPNEANNTLIIRGNFGPTRGKMFFNGSPLTTKSWSKDIVVTELPSLDQGTLRAIGDFEGHDLESLDYLYVKTSIKIKPVDVVLEKGESRTFRADVASGSLPSNSRYRWTVTGKGLVNGQSMVETGSSTVQYVAPQEETDDVIKVELLSQNEVVATDFTRVFVGVAPSVSFTVNGIWDGFHAPPIGNYHFLGGEGARFAPEPGKEALSFAYRITSEENVGVLFTIMIPPGSIISKGTYTKVGPGQALTPGKFQLTMHDNLDDPDDPNSTQAAVGTSGTLEILSVVNLPGNRFAARYTFNVKNGAGGTVSGFGSQNWGP